APVPVTPWDSRPSQSPGGHSCATGPSCRYILAPCRASRCYSATARIFRWSLGRSGPPVHIAHSLRPPHSRWAGPCPGPLSVSAHRGPFSSLLPLACLLSAYNPPIDWAILRDPIRRRKREKIINMLLYKDKK